jgi:rhodanese-related sulfurtransferase
MLVDKLEITPNAVQFELEPGEVHAALSDGVVLVDGRAPEAYDACHVPGSVNVPLSGGSFPVRVLTAVGPDGAAIVVAGSDGESLAMAWAIERHAAGRVRGCLSGGIEAYAAAGFETGRGHSLPAERVAGDLALGGAVLVDAREDDDWVRGHVPGSLHVPLRSVAAAAKLLPTTPVVVACTDGTRAATAASMLRRLGHANVWRVAGAGVPVLMRCRLGLGGI